MKEFIIKFDTDKPLSELASGTTVMALMKVTGDCDEIIRCKDCKYYHADRWGYGNCNQMTFNDRRVRDADYCCWAERKEE